MTNPIVTINPIHFAAAGAGLSLHPPTHPRGSRDLASPGWDDYLRRCTIMRDCVKRVFALITRITLPIPEERETPRLLNCSITLTLMERPVVTPCGHTFEETAIMSAKAAASRAEVPAGGEKLVICPSCRASIPIDEETPLNATIQAMIDDWKKKNAYPIPTFEQFIEEKDVCAMAYLHIASMFAPLGEYNQALDAYRMAFKYTKTSEDYEASNDYAEVPLLYEKLKDWKNAALAYLFLAYYQFKEGKVEEARLSLTRYKSVQGRLAEPVPPELDELLQSCALYTGTSGREWMAARNARDSAAAGAGMPSRAPARPKRPILPLQRLEATHPASKAWKDCIKRVNDLIGKLTLSIPAVSEDSPHLNCPVTKVLMQTPVVISCGHTFEQTSIMSAKAAAIQAAVLAGQQRVQEAGETQQVHWVCPVSSCGTPIPVSEQTVFPLNVNVKGLIDDWKKKNVYPIPTFEHFIKENEACAVSYLQIAFTFAGLEEYEESLEAYHMAFKYTKASEDYAKVPLLYEKLKDWNKAALAYLFLAYYQLQEAKVEEAKLSLTCCKRAQAQQAESVPLEIDGLLQSFPLLTCTSGREMIAAVDTALANARSLSQKDLALLNAQIKKFILDAFITEGAHGITAELLRPRLEAILAIDPVEWADQTRLLKRLPSYPPAMQAFLDGDCSFVPGRKRNETHIVVPCVRYVVMNRSEGSPVKPITLRILNELEQAAGGSGCTNISTPDVVDLHVDETLADAPTWAVIPRGVLPGTRNQTYAEQETRVKSLGYQVPSYIDVLASYMWDKRGGKTPSSNAVRYSRCLESISTDGQVCPVTVGKNERGWGVVHTASATTAETVGMTGVKYY